MPTTSPPRWPVLSDLDAKDKEALGGPAFVDDIRTLRRVLVEHLSTGAERGLDYEPPARQDDAAD